MSSARRRTEKAASARMREPLLGLPVVVEDTVVGLLDPVIDDGDDELPVAVVTDDEVVVVGEVVEAIVPALPPTSPTPSVSSSDCNWLLIQARTSVWFS